MSLRPLLAAPDAALPDPLFLRTCAVTLSRLKKWAFHCLPLSSPVVFALTTATVVGQDVTLQPPHYGGPGPVQRYRAPAEPGARIVAVHVQEVVASGTARIAFNLAFTYDRPSAGLAFVLFTTYQSNHLWTNITIPADEYLQSMVVMTLPPDRMVYGIKLWTNTNRYLGQFGGTGDGRAPTLSAPLHLNGYEIVGFCGTSENEMMVSVGPILRPLPAALSIGGSPCGFRIDGEDRVSPQSHELTITTSRGQPSQGVLLVLGARRSALPIPGGCFLLVEPLAIVTAVSSATGGARFPALRFGGLLSAQVYAQALQANGMVLDATELVTVGPP